jgi:hypothetical protein
MQRGRDARSNRVNRADHLAIQRGELLKHPHGSAALSTVTALVRRRTF